MECELTMFQSLGAASPSCQSLAQCTDRDWDSRFSRSRSISRTWSLSSRTRWRGKHHLPIRPG